MAAYTTDLTIEKFCIQDASQLIRELCNSFLVSNMIRESNIIKEFNETTEYKELEQSVLLGHPTHLVEEITKFSVIS